MKKILIVSSSKAFLARNRNLLTRDDFQLVTAHNGADALLLQNKHLFDLILADLYLEDMGGDTLCSLLRSEDSSKNVAIILICYDKTDDHARVTQSGANAKIIRPVQPDQIIDTVSSLLHMQIGRTKRAIFKVKVLTKRSGDAFYCVSLDISITGILLETEHRLEIGDRIACQFTLPGACQIENEGDVVRSASTDSSLYRYGVQFIALPLTSRREIENYVAAAQKKDLANKL